MSSTNPTRPITLEEFETGVEVVPVAAIEEGDLVVVTSGSTLGVTALVRVEIVNDDIDLGPEVFDGRFWRNVDSEALVVRIRRGES